MKQTLRAASRHYQRGSVAVEAAIVFTVLVLFATFPSIFWAFYFYKYSAAQKAVHDAALYLSTAPKLEMATAGPDGNPAALTLATKIIANELRGMGSPDPSIVCTYRQTSGSIVPKQCTLANNQAYNQTLLQLSVSINMSYVDPLTGSDSGLWISPYTIMPYMGN
jgi:Flp pilus assembly protein TadG